MENKAITPDQVSGADVTFRFPDGHTWRYAGHERVWMHEVPIGAEWEHCKACDILMETIGEPPVEEIPFDVVASKGGERLEAI